jgi:hypothetical protein
MGEARFRFLCPGCRASFGWKPQYAGRKIRCKCGQVFMPPDPPAAAPEPETDAYDVNDDAPPARPAPVHRVTPVAEAAAPAPAAPPPPSDRLAGVAAIYGHRARPVTQEPADDEASPLKDLYLPLALLVLGLGLRILQLVVASGNRAHKWGGEVGTSGNPHKAVILAVLELIISGGALLAGATLAAVLLSVNFGSIGKAALKLCALVAFATGVASWVVLLDQNKYSVQGLAIALHLVVIIYWVGFAYLFALEMQETLLTVAIVSLLQAAAMCAMSRA